MPQNAIIRANGTGDYTSPIAWEAAEQGVDYGSITVGRLDGFFDLGSSNLDFNGPWTNGARLECFDSADGFDGTERNLCGITSTNSAMSVRGRATLNELIGLEIYNTGTGEPYQSTTGTPSFSHTECLFHNPAVNVAIPVNAASTSLLTRCVTVAAEHSTQVFNHLNCSHFCNTTSTVGSSGGTMTNTVVVNGMVGQCIRPGVTQSNNATTDSSGDTLTNIVVADNFVSATPAASGDYRVKSGSPLDTNGIGAFVEASGGSTLVAESGAYFLIGENATLLKSSRLEAETGFYFLSGSDVNLLKGYSLGANQGVYAYLGQDVDLIYTPAGSFVLEAESGFYSYIGSDVNFNRDRVIIASSGSYSYDGTDIQIILPGQIWTDKPKASTNWTNQDSVTTIWTDK